MRRPMIVSGLIALLAAPSVAGAEEWDLAAVTGLTLTQATYNTAWAGSEQGSINWVATGLLNAKKQLQPSVNWSNQVELAFGQTYTQARPAGGSARWLEPEKSTDKVRWDAIFRLTLGAFVDPFAASVLETQFIDQRQPLAPGAPQENHAFNPLRLTQSAGVARAFHEAENEEVVSRLGFAFRETFTSLAGDEDTQDGGLEWVTDARGPFLGSRVSAVSKLTLYKALLFSRSEELDDQVALGAITRDEADRWKAMDVNWENTLSAKVSSLVAVNLYFQLVYDKQVNQTAQVKQTLGLGVTYTLF